MNRFLLSLACGCTQKSAYNRQGYMRCYTKGKDGVIHRLQKIVHVARINNPSDLRGISELPLTESF